MKRLLIIVIAIAVVLPSCKKSKQYMNAATIYGPNLRMPPCGGAYNITIHGVADSIAQFDSLPAGSGISLSSFPINVNINWHTTGSSCGVIVIDAVQKAD